MDFVCGCCRKEKKFASLGWLFDEAAISGTGAGLGDSGTFFGSARVTAFSIFFDTGTTDIFAGAGAGTGATGATGAATGGSTIGFGRDTMTAAGILVFTDARLGVALTAFTLGVDEKEENRDFLIRLGSSETARLSHHGNGDPMASNIPYMPPSPFVFPCSLSKI